MAKLTNPYVAGAPLRGEKGFYGRQDTLKWVIRELHNPATNALVLFGQRRIGKTTLLLQLQQTLSRDQFLPVYFDLQDQATRSLSNVLADLADTIAEKAQMEPPPQEAFDDRGRHFRGNFLPELYARIGQCRPVLLLDEFDVLDQAAEAELPSTAAAKSLFPFLRRLMLEESRLAFVFVVGRRAEDLTLDFSATFKASLTREIWSLDQQSAVALVRQAEKEGSLQFTDAGVSRILELTNRHPYLTQLLCQRIWEQRYANNPQGKPLVDAPAVEAAVADALATGYQAFAWLWDGLTPAEKIYAAAFAEIAHEGGVLAEDEVIQILAAHASRLRTREVEMAPRDLVQRKVLDAAGQSAYRFNVELFRRWVQQNKPLRDVKDELDQIDTTAEQLFRVGQSFFQRQQLETAVRYFRDGLEANPRHFRARLYLGEALMQMGNLETAVAELEKAHQLDREEARLPLARTLIACARARVEAEDEETSLDFLEKALRISPHEREAQALRYEIWTRRGDKALQKNDLEAALTAYRHVENLEGVARVNSLIARRQMAVLEQELEDQEKAERWDDALTLYEELLAATTDEDVKIKLHERRQRVQFEQQLARRFTEGIGFLAQQEWDNAARAFADVLHQRPQYSKDGMLAASLLQNAVQKNLAIPHKPQSRLHRYTQKVFPLPRWWRGVCGSIALISLLFGPFVAAIVDSFDLLYIAVLVPTVIFGAIIIVHFQERRRFPAGAAGAQMTGRYRLFDRVAQLFGDTSVINWRAGSMFHRWRPIGAGVVVLAASAWVLLIGDYMSTTGNDGAIHLLVCRARTWNDTMGDPLLAVCHEAAVGGARWNRDGSRFLSWSRDGTVRVWDAFTGNALFILDHGRHSLRGAQWSGDESLILSWDTHTVKVSDARTGKSLLTLWPPHSSVGAQWNMDSNRILTWGGSTVTLWDVLTDDLLLRLNHEGSNLLGAQWSRDESRILTWSDDGTVQVWGALTAPLLTLNHEGSNLLGAQWSQDESRILTWSDDGTVRVWDALTGALLLTLNHEGSNLRSAQWNMDSNRILTWGGRTVTQWDALTGDTLLILNHEGSNLLGAQWSQDESRILTWSSGYTPVRIWDAQTGEHLLALRSTSWSNAGGAQWNRDGDRILRWSSTAVQVWDPANRFLLSLYHKRRGVRGALWSEDESRILSWADDGTVRLWDVARD
jgi:WD40 repeat protein/tetratricopeptide (TPR) repeat protein